MIDPSLHDIANYCVRSHQLVAPPSALLAVCKHLIDSIGCALEASDASAVDVARRAAATARSDAPASVIASGIRSTPEFAAFANTVMIRYFDFNDTGIGGHPSDMAVAKAFSSLGPVSHAIVSAKRKIELLGKRSTFDFIEEAID
jgi:2-methylcitrate dehydratase